MLTISDEPWTTLSKLVKQTKARRIDILTGYVGGGATAALATLNLQARIILGLPTENAALSAAQVVELSQLCTKHAVRWRPGLHAKLYILDQRVVMAGSANLTKWGFEKLDEIMIATDDSGLVAEANAMFASRWRTATQLDPAKLIAASKPPATSPGAPESGLGVAKKGGTSGFSTAPKKTKGKTGNGGTSSMKTGHAVRLLPAWPKWIPYLGQNSPVSWTTSPKAPIGQVHILAITKIGEGIEDYGNDPCVDAIHSIWRTTSSPVVVTGSRWPIQADFANIVVLKKPVPKSDLITAGLIKERWPQNPSSGKLFRGAGLRRLAVLLASANPGQAKKIHAALSPADSDER